MNSLTIAMNMVKRSIGTRKGFLLQILLPCIVISILVGFMGSESNSLVKIAYINQDQQGEGSTYLLKQLKDSKNYELQSFDDVSEMKEYLIKFKAVVGISIPATFTTDLKSGKQPLLQVYEMATSEDSYVARVTLNQEVSKLHVIARNAYASGDEEEGNSRFTSMLAEVEKGNIRSESIDLRLYPKNGLSLVTGFTLMFLMGLVSNTVSQIVEDRSQRTMARIFTAPVSATEIAVGNFLGSVFVGLLQIVILLSISRGVMRYDYGVDLLPHILILGAFMLVTMGLASTVAGLIRNPQNTGMLNNLIMFPTCMLGGCFWPIIYMPDFMQRIANFMPQKWVIQALEQLSAGDPLSSVTTPLSILGLMALILLVVGSAILRPQDSRVGL